MPELYSEYFNENIAKILFKLLDKYNIYNKINYIIINNAFNNDTMIKALKSNF